MPKQSAEAIYGSPERAQLWLQLANPRLDGLTAESLPGTDEGCRAAGEVRVQIDEGYFI